MRLAEGNFLAHLPFFFWTSWILQQSPIPELCCFFPLVYFRTALSQHPCRLITSESLLCFRRVVSGCILRHTYFLVCFHRLNVPLGTLNSFCKILCLLCLLCIFFFFVSSPFGLETTFPVRAGRFCDEGLPFLLLFFSPSIIYNLAFSDILFLPTR